MSGMSSERWLVKGGGEGGGRKLLWQFGGKRVSKLKGA